jgi:hypothetical protein
MNVPFLNFLYPTFARTESLMGLNLLTNLLRSGPE